MSKWLTTGQMIDELRVGEIAESNKTSYMGQDILPARVTRDEDNAIRFDDGTGQCLHMNEVITDLKWRISPRYVSFGEAVEAVKNGKIAYYHRKECDLDPVKVSKYLTINGFRMQSNPTFDDFIKGKWTIEE